MLMLSQLTAITDSALIGSGPAKSREGFTLQKPNEKVENDTVLSIT